MPSHSDDEPYAHPDPFKFDPGASPPGSEHLKAALMAPNEVVVRSKRLVSQVFSDQAGNYSVCGYAERARSSIGEIYLNLDRSPEYERQSKVANAAIGRVDEADGFSVALPETRRVLRCLGEGANIQLIVDRILISLCEYWFGVPDGRRVKPGGLSDIARLPPLCGRDVVFPSAYIFNPKPPPEVEALARAVGPVLRTATTGLVADRRSGGRWPGGVLARAIFEAFPDDDDLASRTIVGAMMGMVPTVDGNLKNVLSMWRSDGTFEELRRRLQSHPEAPPFERAKAVLEVPLKQAMQANPVPEAVWRTAVRPHEIGEEAPVPVQAGDRVFVSIKEATREDLASGITDAFPIFGGDRNSQSSGTHACPGYKMAMGILLGVANGVLEPEPAG